jgi:hypothetical protein
MLVVTVLALLLSNEPLSLFVALIWAAWGLIKLLKAVAKGGVFD